MKRKVSDLFLLSMLSCCMLAMKDAKELEPLLNEERNEQKKDDLALVKYAAAYGPISHSSLQKKLPDNLLMLLPIELRQRLTEYLTPENYYFPDLLEGKQLTNQEKRTLLRQILIARDTDPLATAANLNVDSGALRAEAERYCSEFYAAKSALTRGDHAVVQNYLAREAMPIAELDEIADLAEAPDSLEADATTIRYNQRLIRNLMIPIEQAHARSRTGQRLSCTRISFLAAILYGCVECPTLALSFALWFFKCVIGFDFNGCLGNYYKQCASADHPMYNCLREDWFGCKNITDPSNVENYNYWHCNAYQRCCRVAIIPICVNQRTAYDQNAANPIIWWVPAIATTLLITAIIMPLYCAGRWARRPSPIRPETEYLFDDYQTKLAQAKSKLDQLAQNSVAEQMEQRQPALLNQDAV